MVRHNSRDPLHYPSVTCQVEEGKADLYIDGIFTTHTISEHAREMANQIICDVVGEGIEGVLGRKALCVFGIPPETVEELARRLVHLWRADSGLEPPPRGERPSPPPPKLRRPGSIGSDPGPPKRTRAFSERSS
ncbi:hypothetical protein ACQEVF_18090 [Nonomuraea polychroma]|uniref:hypothetical protein n=1 Tax=Nonomuraea polychroma TaxID=46176 RepID=UPI003D915CED